MKFKDYFYVIKSNFVKKISNDNLCRLLFDSVITPLGLMNKNGEIIDYDKGRISEFINGKRPIPRQIRDNVYSPEVIDSIVDYFEERIVIQLVPTREDICYQIIKLVDRDNSISTMSKANLHMIAKPVMLSALLAQTFCYAVKGDSGLSIIESQTDYKSKAPELSLGGIVNYKYDNHYCITHFCPEGYENREQQFKNIEMLYKEVSDIHLNCTLHNKYPNDWPAVFTKEAVTISEDDQNFLTKVAEARNITLPEDFFDLGDLVRNPLKDMNFLINESNIEGSDNALKKYNLFDKLLDELGQAITWCSVESAFTDLRCIKLALCNSGGCADQDITITLSLPRDTVMTIADLTNKIDDTVLNSLLSDFDGYTFFGIPRTTSYLDYKSSIDNQKNFWSDGLSRNVLIKNQELINDMIEKELSSIFNYQFYDDGDKQLIMLGYDEIMHNTVVAFPTVLLLNKQVSKIDYSIRSRNMSSVYTGSITIAKD